VNRLLLTSGALINEINTVRNHISSIKGGRLATRISPGEIINLIVADEPDAKPWGPTVPDRSTFEDAIRILREYGLWQGTPQRVRRHLQRGLTDRRLETPKSLKSVKVQNVILADNQMACEAARMGAIQLGLNATVLTCNLEGESAAVGESIAALALRSHLARSNRGTPTVLILGGETVVTMSAEHGLGGPSQELALSFARKIAGYRNIALLALDTDGSDGPTDVAGAIVDSLTMKRAEKLGLDLADSLRRHLSYDALSKLQDAIVTGPTGTNVMDLNIVVVI